MAIETHRDLDLWKRAVELATATYQLTLAFPASERFGLTQQLRRAAVSVASNIAEGAARGTSRDFIRFLHIARGSLAEWETQIEIARRCGIPGTFDEAATLARIVGQLLNGLIRSLARNEPPS